jgi:phosphogluconate dehydratase
MSGASGKVPAAIHLVPEASYGGLLAQLQTGDVIRLDATTGVLSALIDATDLEHRAVSVAPAARGTVGRILFNTSRQAVSSAEEGASSLFN